MPINQKTLVFSGKTSTYTSPAIDVSDAEAISAEFQAVGITSGNGVFKIQGSDVDSPGSGDWVDVMLVDNLANTNAQNLTRITSKTLSSNTNALAFLDGFVAKALKYVRIVCTITTDGSYSASLNIQRKAGAN